MRTGPGDDAAPLLTPKDTMQLFAASSRWLDAELDRPFAGPTVVVTHHAPTLHSIHPRFAGSPINAAFVSDAVAAEGRRAQLWIHGHTHDSFDYEVDGTRVLRNPRGYAREGKVENAMFNPELVVGGCRQTASAWAAGAPTRSRWPRLRPGSTPAPRRAAPAARRL